MSQLTPEVWIEWQIEHYSDRVKNARHRREKFWLRKELYNLKQQQKKYDEK